MLFPFVPQMEGRHKKLCWTAFVFPCSYVLTILVNTIRILLSIYLPVMIERYFPQKNPAEGFFTPARLHTLIGTFVYFTSLCIIYHLAGLIIRRPFRKFFPPAFFYLALVLGVPLLNGALQNSSSQFEEYALLVLAVCLTVMSGFGIIRILIKKIQDLL